jgi:hypothetical protein
MFQVRFHGRGGQGVVTAAELLAPAAFREGRHAFGPLVVFGIVGVASEVFADQSARLTPLTDADADKLIRSVRSASVLSDADGRAAADLQPLRDLLIRASQLADDLPEVTDLDLSPVVVRPGGVTVTGARITMTPYAPQDPFLRKLR